MNKMKPVTFFNRKNLKLFGILHEPDPERRRNTGIILLSPGVKMRVAPHRMYNKMAEVFVEKGYPVLRFDFTGLGDAEGDIDLKLLSVVYNSIQTGRYVEDTIDAIEWMESDQAVSEFVVGGLCGGAITGLLSAENERRIVGLLGLGIPVALDPGEADRHKYMSKGQLDQLRGGYIKNLMKPESWLRLLTFKSDYRVIFKMFRKLFDGGKKRHVRATAPSGPLGELNIKDNTNPKFAPAFFGMMETSRPVLLIFSGNDRLGAEFDEKFVEMNQRRLDKYPNIYEVHMIDGANHILADPAWMSEMIAITCQWLLRFK